jgi:hypothetical protein
MEENNIDSTIRKWLSTCASIYPQADVMMVEVSLSDS